MALYVPLFLLDVSWNLVRWRFNLGLSSILLLVWIAVAVSLFGRLAGRPHDAVSRVISLLLSLALCGAGIYASQPEPLTTGLFERTESSPTWYRAGRAAVLALPLVFWIVRPSVRKRAKERAPAPGS